MSSEIKWTHEEGIQRLFNKAVILTGITVAAANPAVGAGIVVVGVGARLLKEAEKRAELKQSETSQNKI